MTNLLARLRLPLHRLSFGRFARDEGAAVIAEAVIVLPLFL